MSMTDESESTGKARENVTGDTKKPLPRATNLPYEVDAARTKPAFGTGREACGLIGGGVLSGLVALGLGWLFAHALIGAFGGIRAIRDVRGSGVCGGMLGVLAAPLVGLQALMLLTEGLSILVKRRHWRRRTSKARASIIDTLTEESFASEMDYNYNVLTISYFLIMRVDDHLGVPELDDRFIRAEVSQRIFNRYARKRSAVIYYATHSPLALILRGE